MSSSPDPTPITCSTNVQPSSSPKASARHNASDKPRQRLVIDETSIAGVQHKPSIGGASFAHLVSELSATSPDMIKNGLRAQGQSMDEESRTTIRRTAKWLMGFPLVVGTLWVGWEWAKGDLNAVGGSKAKQS